MHGHWPRRFLAHGTRRTGRGLVECRSFGKASGGVAPGVPAASVEARPPRGAPGAAPASVAARPPAAGVPGAAPASVAARPLAAGAPGAAHGAYGTASMGSLARDQPLWHDGVITRQPAARRPMARRPPAGTTTTGTYAAYHPPTTVNYYGLAATAGWSTASAAGAAVGMVAGAAVASANTAAATSSAYSAGYAAGATTTAGAWGDLCDAPDWLRVSAAPHNLLPLRHDVVPAVLRRERRLLPCGADALRWLAPVPLVHPASGTGHEENHMRHKENHAS